MDAASDARSLMSREPKMERQGQSPKSRSIKQNGGVRIVRPFKALSGGSTLSPVLLRDHGWIPWRMTGTATVENEINA